MKHVLAGVVLAVCVMVLMTLYAPCTSPEFDPGRDDGVTHGTR